MTRLHYVDMLLPLARQPVCRQSRRWSKIQMWPLDWALLHWSKRVLSLMQKGVQPQDRAKSTMTGNSSWHSGTTVRRVALFAAVIFAVGLNVLAWALRPQWTADAKSGCKVWNASAKLNMSLHWDGPCKNGIANGRGTLTVIEDGKPDAFYQGDFIAGHITGRGVKTWARGSEGFGGRYEGDLVDGALTGHGVYVYPNGGRYEGGLSDGKRSGFGTYRYPEGGQYDGEWLNQFQSGNGVRSWADGSRYDGRWANGLPNGFGTLSLPDGQVYSGSWTNGCFRQGNRTANAGVTRAECNF
jgi:hypothetical protein